MLVMTLHRPQLLSTACSSPSAVSFTPLSPIRPDSTAPVKLPENLDIGVYLDSWAMLVRALPRVANVLP